MSNYYSEHKRNRNKGSGHPPGFGSGVKKSFTSEDQPPFKANIGPASPTMNKVGFPRMKNTTKYYGG